VAVEQDDPLETGGREAHDDVLDEFLRQPTRMPAANVRETRRRLSALVRGQSDPQLESLRQQALIATVLALASFVAILVVSSR
jgi:hypothetical protein